MITLREMELYWDVVNPISGCTLKEEIEIQRVIGGRLPYEAQLSLIRRGIVPPPKIVLLKEKKPLPIRTRRVREYKRRKEIKEKESRSIIAHAK